MRVCLLEPTASVLGLSTYAAHNILEPLGLEYLASHLEQAGHTCEVLQQRCDPREKVLAAILDQRPQVLGIGTQAYNIDDALWFAAEVKRRKPDTVVVLGGYHASAMPNLATRQEVDFVIIGEGETALADLLRALENKEPMSNVLGLAYKTDGKLHTNPRPQRIGHLDALPFPKRKIEILRQCRMHGLMLPSPSQQSNVATVTATRGCPYSCAFCCSQLIWNHEIRQRSPANVADELELLATDFAVNGVFFCDLTFNANKKYAIALCTEIARRNIPIHFYAMCHLRGMDSEIAGAMAAAKCSKVGFGVESFIEPTRLHMKDQGGMDLASANSVLDQVSAAGILTKCYFIVGFPWETRDSVLQLQQDVCHLRADEIKATFYVPFPGTRGYEEHSNLLTTRDWSKFTTLSEPVVHNASITAEELKILRKELFAAFYNGANWQNRVRDRVLDCPKYSDSFKEFAQFLRSQGVLRQDLWLDPDGGDE
jgi:anaerobic magnesium-protoporphyrin IX monomethyl ester cyclase